MPSIANYIKSDLDSLDYVVTGAPVLAGTPVLISPGFYGIPGNDAAVGSTVALRVRGIFAIDKVTPAASYSVGTMLEFNGSTGLHVGGGAGTFRVMAPCAAGDKKVCVRINVETGSGGGGGGSASWGFIAGTLSAQVDLQAALDAKAASSHVHSFASITAKPTTLAGYGITDAQPLDGDLTAIAALTTNTFGRALLTLSSANDLAFVLPDNGVNLAKLVNASAASVLMGRRAGSAGAWEEITLGSGLTMTGTTISASGGGGGGATDPPGLFVVDASGVAATDNANIAQAVADAIAYGDGAIIEFRGTATNKEIYVTTNHAFGLVSVSLQGGPGFEGLIYTTSSSGFFWGADYYPWDLNPIGRIPLGVARNNNQLNDLSRFRLRVTATSGNYTLTLNGLTTGNIAATADATAIQTAINAVGGLNGNITVAGSGGDFVLYPAGTLVYNTTFAGTANNVSLVGGTATLYSTTPTVGKWYAFWSDNNVTEATWHASNIAMRPLEFHRIARQVVEAKQFSLTIAGTVTGGSYAITINGLTVTGISHNANASAIQSAVNGVGGLNGNVTVSGAGPFLFDMVGSFRNQQNTMSVNESGLTGGSTPRATLVASQVPGVNKWLLADTMYDPMTAASNYYVEIPTVHNVRISNINVRSADGVTPSGSTFYLGGCIDYLIENCRIGNKNARNNPGVIFSLFCTGTMKNVQVYDHEDPNNSMSAYYGMGDASCNRIVRENVKFGATRHGYTTYARARNISGVDYRYGGNLNAHFEKCYWSANPQYLPTTGAQQSAPLFDTHTETSRLTLSNCQWDVPANQVGISIRGRDVTVLNPTIRCADSAFPINVTGKNFTCVGGTIDGGFISYVRNYGTQADVDNARFLGVTWKNYNYCVLRVETGTGLEVDSCKFLGAGGTAVASPWCPRAPIYIKSLTNNTTARARITNNTAPKYSNVAFVYPGDVTLDQLYYSGNEGATTYGGSSIGIARTRETHGVEGFGTAGAAIQTTIEWEMLYGVANGHPKYVYRQKTAHGLTLADKFKPIVLDISGAPAYSIYDDTTDEQPIGLLFDVPHESAVDANNFIVIAPHGLTLEIPKTFMGGTHSSGTDKPTGYWDLSDGKYEAVKPLDSHANATPIVDITAFTANLMQVTVNLPGVSFVNTGAFGESWLGATAATDAVALLTSTPLTVAEVTAGAFKSSSSQIITQSGTARTLSAADNGKIIKCTSSSATTITVPTGLGAGFSCKVIREGSGSVTFAASSTTINSPGGLLAISAQHRTAELLSTATNVFNLDGSLS